MSPHLAETLISHKTEQKKIALKNGRSFSEFVFANKKGKIFGRMAFRNALERCLENGKIKRIRVHDIRHTYATIRLMRGHNIGDVSYQLGHSSISMTYDLYTHWIPGHFKNEVDELDFLPNQSPFNPNPEQAVESQSISSSFE